LSDKALPIRPIAESLLALALLILLSPLLIIIAAILLASGDHKILFFSERVGRNGKLFRMVKFSTMENKGHQKERTGLTLTDDPRILPFGRWLRRTKLDELPQLVHVLTGEMAFAGPRPLLPDHFRLYSLQQQEIIASMRPGLTGMGSVFLRDEAEWFGQTSMSPGKYYEQVIMPLKASLEKWYHENRSLKVDIKILLCTLVVLWRPESKLPLALFREITIPGMLTPDQVPHSIFSRP